MLEQSSGIVDPTLLSDYLKNKKIRYKISNPYTILIQTIIISVASVSITG